MKDCLNVGIVQFSPSIETSINFKLVQQQLSCAAPGSVDLFIFPEASQCSFISPLEELKKIARVQTPLWLDYLSKEAIRIGSTIVIGLVEDDPTSDKVYNTLFVINPLGQVMTRYHKIHLYDAFSFKESDKVRPSKMKAHDWLGVFPCLDFKVGLINCYDLRFPELSRCLIDQDVDVIVVSAAWIDGQAKYDHWDILTRARAIENISYVLACSQSAPRCVGSSRIIDSMGTKLAELGSDVQGLLTGQIFKSVVQEARHVNPSLGHRVLKCYL